jgi:23S rRNA (guanine745-N1)-methyltransferase
MLLCPVRDCQQSLVREPRRLVCSRGHSFDIARSGYANLLQPQDRRSKQPGDTPQAVAARRRLHDLGVSAPLNEAIGKLAAPTASDVVLDAGCGDGYHLGTLAALHKFAGQGVDISIPAIDAAAKRYPYCEWVVANADRVLPYEDNSFSLVLSITARMNPEEFYRVLQPTGRLLIAIPAPDDLIEVRGAGRDRVERTIESFQAQFSLIHSGRATHRMALRAAAVEDIRHAVYRPLQAEPAADTTITFSLDLLLFHPRGAMLKA